MGHVGTTELARRCIARGITQTEFAQLPKINRSTLACVENGHTRAWPRLRREAARLLDVPEAELFPEIVESAQ